MSIVNESASRQDPVAFAFLIAVGLALACVTGAALGGVASGAVKDMLLAVGFGQDSIIKAEQRRQALALARIETSVGLMRGQVALLNARADDADARHDGRSDAVKRIDKPDADPVAGEIDLGALRTSLDDHIERNHHQFAAVNKRIDWLETLVYSQDATGSIQPTAPSSRRHGARLAPAWIVLHAEKDVAVIAGKSGALDVTPGFVIPELGRVAAIRQEGGRWVVVTDKGMTIRER
jgi:hypothetical protein